MILSDNAKKYERLLVELHREMSQDMSYRPDKVEEQELACEAIRDRMDELTISDEEESLLQDLSADLYFISEQEEFRESVRDLLMEYHQVATTKECQDKLYRLISQSKWKDVLRLLPLCPEFLSWQDAAKLYAVSYQKLGFLHASENFRFWSQHSPKESVDLDGENSHAIIQLVTDIYNAVFPL